MRFTHSNLRGIQGLDAHFEVTVEMPEIDRWVEGAKERSGDLKPFWGKVGGILRERMADNFRQAGPPGYRWSPLKGRTVHGKHAFLTQAKAARVRPFSKKGKPPPRLTQLGEPLSARHILIKTGRLRDSWVQKNAPGHVERVEGNNTFVFGSKLQTPERGLTMRQIIRNMTRQSALKPMHTLTKGQLARHQKGIQKRLQAPLAAIHELGAPKKHIPARPQFGGKTLDPGDRKRIERLLIDHIVGHATGESTGG